VTPGCSTATTRPRALPETLVVWLSATSCVLMTGEIVFGVGPWLTAPGALWNVAPALLWSVGMVLARRHPLDRAAVGAGLSTILPHIYQTLLDELPLVPAFASGLLLVAAFAWCAWREEPKA
jgi:hypothetical protein